MKAPHIIRKHKTFIYILISIVGIWLLRELFFDLIKYLIEDISNKGFSLLLIPILIILLLGLFTRKSQTKRLNIEKSLRKKEIYLNSTEGKITEKIQNINKFIEEYEKKHNEFKQQLSAQLSDNKKHKHLEETSKLFGEEVAENLKIVVNVYESLLKRNKQLKQDFQIKLEEIQFLKRAKKRQLNIKDLTRIEVDHQEFDEFAILAELQEAYIITEEINNELKEANAHSINVKTYQSILEKL